MIHVWQKWCRLIIKFQLKFIFVVLARDGASKNLSNNYSRALCVLFSFLSDESLNVSHRGRGETHCCAVKTFKNGKFSCNVEIFKTRHKTTQFYFWYEWTTKSTNSWFWKCFREIWINLNFWRHEHFEQMKRMLKTHLIPHWHILEPTKSSRFWIVEPINCVQFRKNNEKRQNSWSWQRNDKTHVQNPFASRDDKLNACTVPCAVTLHAWEPLERTDYRNKNIFHLRASTNVKFWDDLFLDTRHVRRKRCWSLTRCSIHIWRAHRCTGSTRDTDLICFFFCSHLMCCDWYILNPLLVSTHWHKRGMILFSPT